MHPFENPDLEYVRLGGADEPSYETPVIPE